MMENKAVIGETDMLQVMQQDALRFAGKALDQYDVTDSTEIAHLIKKVVHQLNNELITYCFLAWTCLNKV